MKNNRASGDDQIVIEAIKAGGGTVVKALSHLYNKRITASKWNKEVIIISVKKRI